VLLFSYCLVIFSVFVSVTHSVSYLSSKFVLFCDCGSLCRISVTTTYNLRNIPHQNFRKLYVHEIPHSAKYTHPCMGGMWETRQCISVDCHCRKPIVSNIFVVVRALEIGAQRHQREQQQQLQDHFYPSLQLQWNQNRLDCRLTYTMFPG